MKLKDAQQEFIDNLLASFDKGIIPWHSTWDRGVTKPVNGVSGKPYRGMNQLNLWMKSLSNAFDDPRWMTFKQANEKGCKIKKGSIGSNVYHYSFKDKDTNKYIPHNEYAKLTSEEKKKVQIVTKVYKVFNGNQIDGLEPLPESERMVSFSNQLAEDFIDELQKGMNVKILDDNNGAFYVPDKDEVHIPKKEIFHTEQGYYGTLLHELGHATSHESRLNREVSTAFGSEMYAIEELRAEITSAFLSMDIGFTLDNAHEQNHQAYIQSWSRAIKNDRRVLFDAIKDATKIQEYLVETGDLENLKLNHKQELSDINQEGVQVQGTRPQAKNENTNQVISNQPFTGEIDYDDLKVLRSEEDIAKSILTKWNNELPAPYHIVEADKGNYKVAIFDHPGKAEHYYQYRHALNEWVNETRDKSSILQVDGLDNLEIAFLKKTYAIGVDNRVFVDMDGVLARFNNQISSMEVLYEKGYYLSLEPLENVVNAVSDLINNDNVEVYILSAVLDSEYAADEKKEWLQKYLPEMNSDHIIFSEYGYPKANYIPGGIRSDDILIDDYTNNLNEWTSAGGRGIKLVNDINDTNQTWVGQRLNYDEPELTDYLVESIDQLHDLIDKGISDDEFDIEGLFRNNEMKLSNEEKRDALQELLHNEQEKLNEMMKVEQFHRNEKMILQQQKVVDGILRRYNATLSITNNPLGGAKEKQTRINNASIDDLQNWKQSILDQEVSNEEYLKLGKIQIESADFKPYERWQEGTLDKDYYLIQDGQDFITVDNRAGECFVEEFENKEVAIQYLRDTIEGTGADREPIDYLQLDASYSDQKNTSENEVNNDLPETINTKDIDLDAIDYQIEISHFLDDRRALIYLHMDVPVGYNVNVYENGKELERFEFKYLSDEEKAKVIDTYKPINSIDHLAEVEARINRGSYMVNPEFMTAQEAVQFNNTFQWLTDKSYNIFSEEKLNDLQQELLDNKPMNKQKMDALRDKYITNELIEKVAAEHKVEVDRLCYLLGTDAESADKNNKSEKQQTKNSKATLDTMKNSVSIAEYARDVLGLGLIKESRGMFRLDAHDSCKIYPNNTFYRFSQGVGGSIIDFIKHFQEVDTKEAIAILKSYYNDTTPEERFNAGEKSENRSVVKGFDKDLEVPEKGSTNKNVYAYLTKTRGISPDVVNDYMKRGLLYQDVNNNCVFLGRLDRTIHYAMVRGTGKGKFRQDVSGSVKEVGVYVDNNSDTLILNEAAIDQMSYMTLAQNSKSFNYLATNGAANAVNALRFHMNKRSEASNLKRIVVALDNDKAGLEYAEKTIDYLKESYPDIQVDIHLPENANDFNDQLVNSLKQMEEIGLQQDMSGSTIEMV